MGNLGILLFLLSNGLIESQFHQRETTIINDNIDYRLPKTVIPTTYDIYLWPNFLDSTFIGRVTIEFDVTEDTNNITINSHQIIIDDINGVLVADENDNYPGLLPPLYDERRQFVHIGLVDSFLSPDHHYTMTIRYRGILNDVKQGFYRANYTNSKGETKWFATTQMEPTFARQVFPCFDEPAFKATFVVNSRRSMQTNSLSNTVSNEIGDPGDGTIIDVFLPTPKMSTYLVAVIVSDFIPRVNQEHRVYARPEAVNDGRVDFALDVGKSTLEFLSTYTKIDYANSGLTKLYQVAIPDEYFKFGAMENWGLITYKEKYLLYKENVTTTSEQFLIATIIAHEYSHQWFGDLVTPEWWDVIWLNEGFATYFEYFAASQVKPNWNIMDQFTVKVLQLAFESDALMTTRPMTFNAESPEGILALFDRVAYEKSGSVIRMVQHFLTEPVFQSGLILYLYARKSNTARDVDLWRNLQIALNAVDITALPQKLEEVMGTWTSQAGYPVVHVSINYTSQFLFLNQERFLISGPNADEKQVWTIPISYVTESSADFSVTNPQLWLTKQQENYNIPELNETNWVILNTQQTGYYRVNYDLHNWKLLTDYLTSDEYNKIHIINRAQLIDDVFNLARAGYLDYAVALDLTNYTSRETDYVPLYSFLNAISYVDRLYSAAEIYSTFREHVIRLLRRAYNKLGVNLVQDEPFIDRLNRINVLNWLVRLGDDVCLQEMYNNLINNIHPDLEEPVYCGGVKFGGIPQFAFVVGQYNIAKENAKRNRLLNALGCTRNEPSMNRLLLMSMGEDGGLTLRDQDRAAAFIAAYSHSHIGVNKSLDFFISRYADIVQRFTTDEVSTILNGLSLRCVLPDQIIKLSNFINQFVDKSTFAAALNNVVVNSLFTKYREQEITAWFESMIITTTTPIIISSTPKTGSSTPNTALTTPSGGTDLHLSELLFSLWCCLIISLL